MTSAPTKLTAMVAAALITLLTFQQAVVVPVDASPVVDVRLA